MNNTRHHHVAKRLGISVEIVAGIAFTVWATTGMCATDVNFDLDIAQGDLRDQLIALGRATQSQLIFEESQLPPLQTLGLHGRYSTEQALIKLIQGTGLVCEQVADAYSIRRSDDKRSLNRCLRSRRPAKSHQATPGSPSPDTTDNPAVIRVTADKMATHLPNGLQVGAEIRSFSAQDIRESGAHDTADLLKLITGNFAGGATEDTHNNAPEAAANSGAGVSGNLRGAGSRATLLLVNGLPVALSGSDASFGDLLQIPLSFIDSIDILPDGASAIYGAEAVGGVINIHTVEQYVQPVTSLEIGSVTSGHQEQHRLSQLGGTAWEGGGFVVGFEMSHRGNLPSSARWQANANLRPLGPDGDVPYADPGNLYSPDGTTYRVPNGQSRQPLDVSSLLPAAPNLANPWADASNVPDQSTISLYASAHHQFNSVVALSFTSFWTQRRAVESWGGQLIGNLDVTNTPFLLHAPPGTTENYNLLDSLGSQLSSAGVRTLNTASKLQISLPGDCQLVFRGSAVREWESQLTTGHTDKDVLQAAVDSGIFDPLGSGGVNTPAEVTSIERPLQYDSLSELNLFQAVASGQFLDIGAGPWSEALGLEYHDQGFRSWTSDPVFFSDLRRRVYAAFVEIEAPLLDSETLPMPLRNLSVSLAGRYDKYTDFGHSAVPRVGLGWGPIPHLQIMGTWGWSVRAPNLGDLSEKANGSSVYNLGVPILIWGGGNAKLTTERALTRSLGFLLTWLETTPRVSLEARYFGLTYEGRIDQPQLEPNMLTDPQYASYVVLNPSAAQLANVCDQTTFSPGTHADCLQQRVAAIVDLRLHNQSTLFTNGIDVQTKMAFDTAHGNVGLDIQGTYILEYQQVQAPQSPPEVLLNRESQPLSLHLLANAWWQYGGAKAMVTWHHQNRYNDTETTPTTPVGSWSTTDLRLSYTFGSQRAAKSRTVEVAAFCENLFNRLPPFSVDLVDNRGYDAENGDLAGRTCAASLRVAW